MLPCEGSERAAVAEHASTGMGAAGASHPLLGAAIETGHTEHPTGTNGGAAAHPLLDGMPHTQEAAVDEHPLLAASAQPETVTSQAGTTKVPLLPFAALEHGHKEE